MYWLIAKSVGISLLADAFHRLSHQRDTAEHEKIMRAVLARNVGPAEHLHNVHIERTTERVAKSLDNAVRVLPLRTANGKIVK